MCVCVCLCNSLLQQPVLMSRCVDAPRRAASFVFYFGLCSWQLSSLAPPLSLSASFYPSPSLWCCCAFYCCAAAVCCVCAEIAFLCILHFNKFLQLRCCCLLCCYFGMTLFILKTSRFVTFFSLSLSSRFLSFFSAIWSMGNLFGCLVVVSVLRCRC